MLTARGEITHPQSGAASTMTSDALHSLNAERWRLFYGGQDLKGESGRHYPTIMLMIKTHSDIYHESQKTQAIEIKEFN
jgi:hypothetical protein